MTASDGRPDPLISQKRSPNPLEGLNIPSELERQIEEIDETAILNELLRAVFPELAEPAGAGAPPAAAPAPAASALAAPRAPEPPHEAPPAAAPIPPPEEKAEKEGEEGSWLFDEAALREAVAAVEQGAEAPAAEAPAAEAAAARPEAPLEPKRPAAPAPVAEEKAEKEPEGEEGSWLFDEAALRDALTVLEKGGEAPAAEPVPEAQPPIEEGPGPAKEEPALLDEKTLDEAFAALAAPTAEPAQAAAPPYVEPAAAEPVGAEAAAPKGEEKGGSWLFDETTITQALSSLATSGKEAAAPGEVEAEAAPAAGAAGAGAPPELVARITQIMAERYLERLSREMVEEEAAEPLPEEFVVVGVSEEKPAEGKEAWVPQAAPLVPDIDALLTEQLVDVSESRETTAEPTFDEVISSAVLEVAEPAEPAPAPAAAPAAPAEPPSEAELASVAPAPQPAATEGAADIDEYIAEIRRRRRRRTVVLAVILCVIMAAAGFFAYRSWRGGREELARARPTPAQPETTAVVQAPAADTGVQAAVATTEVPPTVVPAAGMPRTVAQPPPTSVPGGMYTVHVESYASLADAGGGKTKWQGRGYDVVMWPWINPADGRQWYRLGIGRCATEADARAAKERVTAAYPAEIDWAPVTRIPEGAQ